MSPYAIFLAFVLAATGVVGLTLALNALLGPRPLANAVKLEPFECGAEPVQPRNVRRLSVKYYPVALFFLLFDVETVLLFIWAGSTGQPQLAAVWAGSFAFFMGTLALVFAYLWKQGGFEWR